MSSSRFSDVFKLSYHEPEREYNQFDDSVLVTVQPDIQPSAGSDFQLSYQDDKTRSGYFLDARNSYIQLRITNPTKTDAVTPIGAQDAVLHPESCLAWLSRWSLELNGSRVDGQDVNPEVEAYLKKMYMTEEKLKRWGTMSGLFLSRSVLNGNDVTNELYSKTTPSLIGVGNYTTLQIPLDLISTVFDYSVSKQTLMPVKSIVFQGTRSSNQDMPVVQTTATAFFTNPQIQVKMFLNYVKPSPSDMARFMKKLKEDKGFKVLYTRRRVAKRTTALNDTQVAYRSTERGLLNHYVLPCHVDGDNANNVLTRIQTLSRLKDITSSLCTLGGLQKPYPTQLFTANLLNIKNGGLGDFTILYREYLRNLGATQISMTNPPVDYSEFYWSPVITYKLDQKLPGTGISPHASDEEIYSEVNFGGAHAAGHVFFVNEFSSMIEFDSEYNIISTINT